jgi:hypothetical protein
MKAGNVSGMSGNIGAISRSLFADMFLFADHPPTGLRDHNGVLVSDPKVGRLIPSIDLPEPRS